MDVDLKGILAHWVRVDSSSSVGSTFATDHSSRLHRGDLHTDERIQFAFINCARD